MNLEEEAIAEADRIDLILRRRKTPLAERLRQRCEAGTDTRPCGIRPFVPGARLCAVHTYQVQRGAR